MMRSDSKANYAPLGHGMPTRRRWCCVWKRKDTLFVFTVIDLLLSLGLLLHWQVSPTEAPALNEFTIGLYSYSTSLVDVFILAFLRVAVALGVVTCPGVLKAKGAAAVLEWMHNFLVLYLTLPKLLLLLFGDRHTDPFVWICLASQTVATLVIMRLESRLQQSSSDQRKSSDSATTSDLSFTDTDVMQIALLEKQRSGDSDTATDTETDATPSTNGRADIDVDPVDSWTAFTMLVSGLIRYGRPWRITLVILFNVAAGISQTASPRLVGMIIDGFEDDRDFALTCIIYLLVLQVVEQVLNASMRKMEQDQSACIERGFANEAMQKLAQLEMAFFDNSTSGELTSRITNDISNFSERLKWTWPDVPNMLTFAVCAVYFMMGMNVRLTILSFASIPLGLFISKKFGDYLFYVEKASSDLTAVRTKIATESIGSMRTIKNFGAEQHMVGRFQDSSENLYNLQARRNTWWGLNDFSWDLWPKLTKSATLFVFIMMLAPTDALSIGELATFMMYQNDLTWRMNHFGICYASLMQIIGTAAKVFGIMRRASRMEYNGTEKPEDVKGSITFDKVKFAYPTRPDKNVLEKFSLDVAAGEMVALVGSTGCGKSTILRLLQRLYSPDEGTIAIDGINVDHLEHTHLHRLVSIVEQEPTLFATTVRENILFGLPKGAVTDSDMEAAARKANAHEFIDKLPKGYDTEVGERGVQLSGGQKQRIGIARALVRNPRILLLDEATSALDAEAEALVQEAIERVMKGRTVIVVAHRLSTVRNAHRICVMQPDPETDIGHIVEWGTHEELLQTKLGVYRGLVEKQLS